MQTEHNQIANEVDAIIARAMAEYSQAKGVDIFAQTAEPVQEPEEETIPDPIPANSNSVLVEETTSRFSSASWFHNIQGKTILLAGLGGIGSYVAFLLSRMQPENLILYDDDIVETANMSGQLYGSNNIGMSKVSATCDIISNFASFYNYMGMNERFTEESEGADIMICGFDNMSARKTFYNKWKEHVNSKPEEDKKQCLFIDGRLAAESFQVLCIQGDDSVSKLRYEQSYLFSDAEAEEAVCSYKQTTFMANMIGSVIVNLFVNFCANECAPLVPRDLPFYTEYNAETMYFKVVS